MKLSEEKYFRELRAKLKLKELIKPGSQGKVYLMPKKGKKPVEMLGITERVRVDYDEAGR